MPPAASKKNRPTHGPPRQYIHITLPSYHLGSTVGARGWKIQCGKGDLYMMSACGHYTAVARIRELGTFDLTLTPGSRPGALYFRRLRRLRLTILPPSKPLDKFRNSFLYLCRRVISKELAGFCNVCVGRRDVAGLHRPAVDDRPSIKTFF